MREKQPDFGWQVIKIEAEPRKLKTTFSRERCPHPDCAGFVTIDVNANAVVCDDCGRKAYDWKEEKET